MTVAGISLNRHSSRRHPLTEETSERRGVLGTYMFVVFQILLVPIFGNKNDKGCLAKIRQCVFWTNVSFLTLRIIEGVSFHIRILLQDGISQLPGFMLFLLVSFTIFLFLYSMKYSLLEVATLTHTATRLEQKIPCIAVNAILLACVTEIVILLKCILYAAEVPIHDWTMEIALQNRSSRLVPIIFAWSGDETNATTASLVEPNDGITIMLGVFGMAMDFCAFQYFYAAWYLMLATASSAILMALKFPAALEHPHGGENLQDVQAFSDGMHKVFGWTFKLLYLNNLKVLIGLLRSCFVKEEFDVILMVQTFDAVVLVGVPFCFNAIIIKKNKDVRRYYNGNNAQMINMENNDEEQARDDANILIERVNLNPLRLDLKQTFFSFMRAF